MPWDILPRLTPPTLTGEENMEDKHWAEAKLRYENWLKSCAFWFFIIAAPPAVNSLTLFFGGEFNFAFGQIIGATARNSWCAR